MNSTVDTGWFGAVLVLGTIITVSLWLLNKLFPQAAPDLAKHPTHRTDVTGETKVQQRGSREQRGQLTRRS
jgi:hypothetical protein